ncbi:MAG TPA: M48 family metallopeptidase [Thermopolyspora sp.]|jgi:Zn-dependent protease with chaperone function
MTRVDVRPGVSGIGGPGTRGAGIGLALLGTAFTVITLLTTPSNPLPAGRPDPVRDFTAAQIARAEAFDAAISPPSWLSLGVTLIVAGLLVLTPLGARLTGRLRAWPSVVIGVFVVSAVPLVLKWPLGMWYESRLRQYGLSTQDWGSWTADRLKSFAISTALLALTVLVVVALARRWRRWWIPAAAAAFGLTVATSFAYPVLIEPVFNDFTSLRAGPLRTELLAMAERDGVPVQDVLVADASRRTTALNAYVSGFGATRRIVVYDTLLKAPPKEVELVVAHELGHAKTGDVLYGTLIGGLGGAAGVCLLYLIVSSRFVRRRTALPSVADPRAAGLLVGLITLGAFLSQPMQNAVSRAIEARADLHALTLTHDPGTFVAMQKRLAVTNISDVTPPIVEYVLYASHPTAPERIAMARSFASRQGLSKP